MYPKIKETFLIQNYFYRNVKKYKLDEKSGKNFDLNLNSDSLI